MTLVAERGRTLKQIGALITLAVIGTGNLHASTGSYFGQANCTIVYSLKGAAAQSFEANIPALSAQIKRNKIQFINLNGWQSLPHHIKLSGRDKNQFRKQYPVLNAGNQVSIFDKKGRVLTTLSGSVALVDALLACS